MKKIIYPIDKTKKKKFENQVLAGSKRGKKLYSFDDRHDKTTPAEFWFQESFEGLILFVVFYTLACRWSQCLGCNLPSKMSSHHVDFQSIMAQVDYIFDNAEINSKKDSIRKVIISNNGSVLDEATFSTTALMYLLAKLNMNLPNLSALCIETRAEYVDVEELAIFDRALKEGTAPTDLELSIGFEAFDSHIRNNFYRKDLTLQTFEELVKKIAPFNYRLKCYFMLKPVPGITDQQAVEDIHRAIDYLSNIQQQYNISINMHLNPTYAARGTALETEFKKGNYSPPRLEDVASAARKARDSSITIFIGLSDEGLAVEGGSFFRAGDEEKIERLEQFNRSGDFDILDSLCKT
ncbi:MAG: hypothetical protein KAW12_04165 [Candidatus Aminicenantes bacterium]|nr:hypothetical protein [Candidatus Aminicenantes bacterium]